MGLIGATSDVFQFLSEVFTALPFAIQLLIYGAFGGVVLVALLRSIRS